LTKLEIERSTDNISFFPSSLEVLVDLKCVYQFVCSISFVTVPLISFFRDENGSKSSVFVADLARHGWSDKVKF
jgi:hypothetical protein